ncbi:DsbA family protein [Lihuaxuella thermophila]|uniref:Protein-disulfide isomerase n=1 Tax=Lihuaxuella thermophila TaxID=1173111 RepID=A0A1H8G5F8_9BACL|nr:thioredoxin domain-containing protein [Lihuaxuella thermophila]SEN39109.1 Protein-disulfide isomerase [Lihuaxuella thermophila]
MSRNAKIVLWLSLSMVAALLYFQFVFNPTVEPVKAKQTFRHPDILKSSSGTVVGSAQAELTLIIFTDYGCGACRILHQTLKEVEEEKQYVKTGKIKIVYKQVPNHPNAKEAAMAAFAADRQNTFEQMNDLLFQKQAEWSRANPAIFQQYASTLGLDTNKFKKDFDSDEFVEELDQMQKEFERIQFMATPIVIIGDQQINAAPPKETIIRTIEEQLE